MIWIINPIKYSYKYIYIYIPLVKPSESVKKPPVTCQRQGTISTCWAAQSIQWRSWMDSGEVYGKFRRWKNTLLFGGLEHLDYFSIYWQCHTPIWLSYFSEGLKPPTRWCLGQQLLRFSSTEHVDFGTYHATNQPCLFTEHMIKHCAEFSPNFQTDSSRWVLPSLFVGE